MLFSVHYKPKHFGAHELVPKKVHEAALTLAAMLFSQDEAARDNYVDFILLSLFEPKLLEAIDWLRKQYGSAIVNNWRSGGNFNFRGLRMPESDVYSPGSMHSLTPDRLVGACDLSFKKPAEEIRQDIRSRQEKGEKFPFTRMEDDVTWVHVDVKPTGKQEIVFFKP